MKFITNRRDLVKERLGRRLKISGDEEFDWLWDEVFTIGDNLRGRDLPPMGMMIVSLGMMAYASTLSQPAMPTKFVGEFIQSNFPDMRELLKWERDDYEERRQSLEYLEENTPN